MEAMATVPMSAAEVASDLRAVLASVPQGIDVVIEQDHRPVAVLRAQQRSGRPITEILREANQRNSSVTLGLVANHKRRMKLIGT